jgi:hypothetical protein
MRRNQIVVILVIYVIPVAVAAVLLALADLGILAIALVLIEVGVGTAVYLARREPVKPALPSRRPWLVPVLMVGALGVMALIAVIAAKAG